MDYQIIYVSKFVTGYDRDKKRDDNRRGTRRDYWKFFVAYDCGFRCTRKKAFIINNVQRLVLICEATDKYIHAVRV